MKFNSDEIAAVIQKEIEQFGSQIDVRERDAVHVATIRRRHILEAVDVIDREKARLDTSREGCVARSLIATQQAVDVDL